MDSLNTLGEERCHHVGSESLGVDRYAPYGTSEGTRAENDSGTESHRI